MAFIRSGWFRSLLAAFVVLLLAAGAGGTWFYLTFLLDLPALEQIEDFRPSLASRVLARDGRPIGEFYNERRTMAPLESIPEHTRLAFVAAEDTGFYEHAGIDYRAIVRAAWVDLQAREIKEGASTITMQLVKQLLLTPERKFRRKIREMLLALKIEERFTKDEILYLYLNEIYFGYGAWGIAEATRTYFGKPIEEITVSESAMLAGLPQRPSEYSPFRDPVAAERRRRSVIRRMHKMGVLDDAATEAALADVPTLVSPGKNPDYETAGYFTEEVRRYLFETLGGDVVLNGGLVIETTLDFALQQAAVESIESGLFDHDRRFGYRGPVRRVAESAIDAELAVLAKANAVALAPAAVLEQGPAQGSEQGSEKGTAQIPTHVNEPLLGIVSTVDPVSQTARVAFSSAAHAEVFLADVAWARKPNPKEAPRPVRRIQEIFAPGDVTWFTVLEPAASKAGYPDESARAKMRAAGQPELPRAALFQEPQVEGALLSFDVGTGDVLAMVGGRKFANSEFNRATQAKRQPGSAFKPFIYGAALERNYTPVSTLYDRPVVVEDRASGFVWRPKNYGREFYGPMTLRMALAKSVNNATVHLFRDLGISFVTRYARRLGIESPLTNNLTLALGSSDVSLLELTRAYAVYPNHGRRFVPHFISRVTDRDGVVLLEKVALGTPLETTPAPVAESAGSAGSADEEAAEDASDEATVLADAPTEVDGENVASGDQLVPETDAYLMCDLLGAVVKEGTGRGVKRLNAHLAGKTGTTNEQADAWFIGFSPDIVTGVWVGYDSIMRLGWGETGAKAALPIWRDYMQVAIAERPVRDFDAPAGIVFERIDRSSGLLADTTSRDAYFQPFLEHTAPTEFASQRTSVTDTRRSLREDAFQ